MGGRATCGPIASKIKLPPGHVHSTRKSGRQPGSGLLTAAWKWSGLKCMGFRVVGLYKKMKSSVPALVLLLV